MRKIDPATLAVSEAITKQTRRIAFLEEANAASHKHCDELREELTAAQQRAERAEQEATKIRQREVSLLMQWQEKVDAAQQRVAELERELNRRKVEQLKKPTVTDVLSVCQDLTAENARLRELLKRLYDDGRCLGSHGDGVVWEVGPEIMAEVKAELTKGE